MFGRIAARHCVEVVGVVDEGDLDAQLGQRVVEQVVGAAVERRRRHDVVAGLGQVQDASVSAAWPLRRWPSAPTPPSSAAMRASNTACVGFMIRV